MENGKKTECLMEINKCMRETGEEMQEYVFNSKEDLKNFIMNNLKENTIVVLRVEGGEADGEPTEA